MLHGKVFKLMGLVFLMAATIYFLASMFLGPGAKDYSEDIVAGYSFEDTGGYEKHILFSTGKGLPKIVINSRVDDYASAEGFIYVVRRPVEYYREADVLKSRIKNTCEYWAINTADNNIEKIDSYPSLNCK
jgi:hypothetical protein